MYTQRETFADRRKSTDRRIRNAKGDEPQCRRRNDRRKGEFKNTPWWLLTNYVEIIDFEMVKQRELPQQARR